MRGRLLAGAPFVRGRLLAGAPVVRGRLLAGAMAMLILLPLGACGGGDATPAPTATVTPTPTPTPTPIPGATGQEYDVSKCIEQAWPNSGLTVFSSVVPDTLKIDFSRPPGFPNGRLFTDPVVDMTLAVILLDLTKHPVRTLANVPLNPAPGNDGAAFRTSFPYFAPPFDNPPLSGTAGTSFDFRTDAPSAYVQVDRMGMPAVATALIGSATKNAYNDADPATDATNAFTGELRKELTRLVNQLADDLAALRLTPCGTPR
jgi:hypothetical protein